jgi:hypothetical protein
MQRTGKPFVLDTTAPVAAPMPDPKALEGEDLTTFNDDARGIPGRVYG